MYYVGQVVAKDFNKSFENTKKAVAFDNDNIVAIENLAYDYKEGAGTEKNYKEAEKYYLKAIKQDSTTAGKNYVKIAQLHIEGGYGLAKDETQFVKYCELAENSGSTEATEILSYYFNQKGIALYQSKNFSSARQYFRLAVSKGSVKAQENLRTMNENGK